WANTQTYWIVNGQCCAGTGGARSGGGDGGRAAADAGGEAARDDGGYRGIRGSPGDKAGAVLDATVTVIGLGRELKSTADGSSSCRGRDRDVLEHRSRTVASSQQYDARQRKQCECGLIVSS